MSEGSAVDPMHSAWADDDRESRRFYADLLAQHGAGPRATNWGSARGQHGRFEVLVREVDLAHRSLLDVGCGTGELLAFLREHGVPVDYRGLDVVPEMVAHCRERYPDAHFETASVLELPAHHPQGVDVVFASGLFTERRREGRAWVESAIRTMAGIAREALVFNCLARTAEEDERQEFRLHAPDALALARTLSPEARIVDDYHPGDFTVIVPTGTTEAKP